MIRVLICATFLNLIFLVTQGCDTLGNYQRAFAYETNQRATLPHVELQSGQAPLHCVSFAQAELQPAKTLLPEGVDS